MAYLSVKLLTNAEYFLISLWVVEIDMSLLFSRKAGENNVCNNRMQMKYQPALMRSRSRENLKFGHAVVLQRTVKKCIKM